MSEPSLFDLYKDQYYYELKRKTELTQALTIPSGVITILVGGLVVMIKAINYPFSIIESLLLVLFSITIIFIFISVINLSKSYINHEYGYVPTAKSLADWKDKTRDHYSKSGESKTDAELEKLVFDHLRDRYAHNAHINALNNDNKSTYLHKANRFLSYGALIWAITGTVFTINSLFEKEKVYNVQIVETGAESVSKEETEPWPMKLKTNQDLLRVLRQRVLHQKFLRPRPRRQTA